VAASIVLLVLTSSCGVSNLQFQADQRLEFTSPKSGALVSLPATLRWKMRDFRAVGPGSGPPSSDAGYFAVFVDRAPVRPGQTMRALASNDRICLRTPGCPNARYLAGLQVYTTTRPAFTLTNVADLDIAESVQLHNATIVLMDRSGHRIGESAWNIEFLLRRRVAD